MPTLSEAQAMFAHEVLSGRVPLYDFPRDWGSEEPTVAEAQRGFASQVLQDRIPRGQFPRTLKQAQAIWDELKDMHAVGPIVRVLDEIDDVHYDVIEDLSEELESEYDVRVEVPDPDDKDAPMAVTIKGDAWNVKMCVDKIKTAIGGDPTTPT